MFKKRGYEVHVATNGLAEIPFCDVKHTIPFERSPFKFNNIKSIFKLKKIIDDENFDIIHTHTPMGSFVTRLAAINSRKKGTRVIYTAHGFHFYKGAPLLNWLIYYPVEKFMAKLTDCLITINKQDYELAKNKFKTKVCYVAGVGVDTKKFTKKINKDEKLMIRKSIGLSMDDFVIIFPAELNKNKNQLWLIKSLANLINKNRKIHLVLPGQDNLNGKCQKIAFDLNISDNVHFLGHRSDIPNLLKISDIAISSSIREGLPVNILEAMSVGLPIVATDCRGNADLVVNGVNGYTFKLNSADSVVRYVLKIYSDLGLREVLSKNNQAIIDKYMLSNIKTEMANIYDSIEEKILNIRSSNALHILSSNRFSGAENVVVGLINDKGGIYCSPVGDIQKTLQERGVKYVGVKRLSLRQIKSVINSLRPDLIYAHDFKASLLLGYFFGKKHKIISYIHQNPDWLDRKNVKILLYKFVANRFKEIILVSDGIKKRRLFKEIKNVIISVNYNKINKKLIDNLSKEKINKNYDFCFVGRLENVKRPDVFVDLIAKIKEDKSDVKAVIVGNGILENEIRDKIFKMNLDKNIDMVGFQKNPYKYVSASKVLLITSKNEGLPMAILEAVYLKKCFLSFNYPTLSAIFSKSNNIISGICENIESMRINALSLINNHKKYSQVVDYQSKKIESLYNSGVNK